MTRQEKDFTVYCSKLDQEQLDKVLKLMRGIQEENTTGKRDPFVDQMCLETGVEIPGRSAMKFFTGL